ncbi:MAG: ATP-binding protein [Bryobacteraceae bacterium]
MSTPNINSWVTELLGWHGHDRGGVRVPFRPGGSPINTTIETSLIIRLRKLADNIAGGTTAPRWVFLVGGPGNGKSETIQEFLKYLDMKLGLAGTLIAVLTDAFRPNPIVKRRIEVLPSRVAVAATFAERVGRLIIIQDATTTDDARGDAAQELVDELADLITTTEHPKPVFLACVNRGVLARAMAHAAKEQQYGPENDITKLLAELIRAASLGIEALAEPRPSAWPLSTNTAVACWPLDLESIVESQNPPLLQIVNAATREDQWNQPGRCADCTAEKMCPFVQNAAWLRDPSTLIALQSILRRGELANGQRWNFRDALSLTAQLVVGQWSDFDNATTPCAWVHEQYAALADDKTRGNVGFRLLARLFPHALFATSWLQAISTECLSTTQWTMQQRSRDTLQVLASDDPSSKKRIGEMLLELYGPLDPALLSPTALQHPLKQAEDEYSQSVELGNSTPRNPTLAAVETLVLEYLADAEREWDLLGRNAAQAMRVVQTLKRQAAIIVKRSLGARLGHHANETYLAEYELSLRDPNRLRTIKDALQSLLGKNEFVFDMVESFGQPRSEDERTITLTSPLPGIVLRTAPVTSETTPGHDVPRFEVSGTKQRVPITFDFYYALRLRKEGCANSSLPASVRAAIDRVRHLHAGALCRHDNTFLDGTTKVNLRGSVEISIVEPDTPPSLSPTA